MVLDFKSQWKTHATALVLKMQRNINDEALFIYYNTQVNVQ